MRAAGQIGADRIATGHNLNDHIETMLVKLIQGTGLKGICGMAARKEAFIRPLLGITREEIMGHAVEKMIPFVDDSSNQDPNYLRNWVRHRVIPLLLEKNPGFLSVANSLSLVAKEHMDISEHLAEEAWRTLRSDKEPISLNLEGVSKLHPTLQKLVVIKFLKEAFPGHRMSRNHVLQIHKLVQASRGNLVGMPGGTVVREKSKENGFNVLDIFSKTPIPLKELQRYIPPTIVP